MSNFGDSEAEEDSLDESLSNKSDDEEDEDGEEEDGGEAMNDDANDIINDEEEESGGEEEEAEAHHHHRKRPKGTINTLSCPQSFPESILYCVEAYSAVLIKLSLWLLQKMTTWTKKICLWSKKT